MLDPSTLFVLIFLATFVTEDATCIVAGTLAASGAIGLDLAILACFSGIFVSDVGLYLVGRGFGGAVMRSASVRRFVSPESLRRGTDWLERRGASAIFLSRIVSGLRLPTYLAAGFLRVSFPKFALYFFVAAAAWTPLLVGGAYYAQSAVFGARAILGALVLYAAIRLAISLASRKKRRRVVGLLKRMYKWEFWPVQIFYIPVVIHILFLGLRHRSLSLFASANPSIPGGGFIGESKDEIYSGLAASASARPFILRHCVADPAELAVKDESDLDETVRASGLGFPLVLKPDVGERGKGVRIIRDPAGLKEALHGLESPQLLQEFAPGEEFSVFYYRYPGEEKGQIFSVTEKIFPEVTGNGNSTVDELILDDPRAVCLRSAYLSSLGGEAERIPSEGERVTLIEIGTHARGAIFKDGARILTAELERTIDEICRGYEGFYFGRFDLRAVSSSELSRGKGFKIVELNGVTSESTNIYDSRYSLRDAYRILFRQWSIAFEIGKINRRNGARAYSVPELLSMFLFRGRVDATEEPA